MTKYWVVRSYRRWWSGIRGQSIVKSVILAVRNTYFSLSNHSREGIEIEASAISSSWASISFSLLSCSCIDSGNSL